MSKLSRGSYQQYDRTDTGDTVILKAYDPDTGEEYEYQGTVIENIGATLRMQTTKGLMVELRSVKEDDTGDMAVLLAVGGKTIGETQEQTGVNSNGHPIKQERTKLSFDYRVKEFKSESEQLYIG